MGIFDFLKKGGEKSATATAKGESESEELREELFGLILKNNLTEFEALAARNEGSIIRYFPEWKRLPSHISTDKDKTQQWSHCLVVMANYFVKERRRNELMAMLTGVDGSEVINEWKTDLGRSQQLISENNYDEALVVLEGCRERAEKLSGPAAETLRPITMGYLGEVLFQTGRTDDAVRPMEIAWESAENVGDFDAEIAYLRNLYEIHRYAGRTAEAAKYAHLMSDKFYDRGNLVLSSNWKHQGNAVLAGEPPLRVIVKMGDEFFELDDIPKCDTAKVEFIFMRNKVELRPSMHLCELGRELAEQGKLEEAVPMFEEASKRDKYNPVPSYFAAAIYMHLGKYEKAVEAYERTEFICPGWEGCRSEKWLAGKLQRREMGQDACHAMLAAINDSVSDEDRLALCQKALAKYPNFSEMHYQKGKSLAAQGKNDEAMEAFKAGLEGIEEPDCFTRILRDMALLVDSREAKIGLLQKATKVENGNLLAIAMCHYLLRQEGVE